MLEVLVESFNLPLHWKSLYCNHLRLGTDIPTDLRGDELIDSLDNAATAWIFVKDGFIGNFGALLFGGSSCGLIKQSFS